jgi:hypothetical protein
MAVQVARYGFCRPDAPSETVILKVLSMVRIGEPFFKSPDFQGGD